jgi:hypothetical protein
MVAVLDCNFVNTVRIVLSVFQFSSPIAVQGDI